MHDWVGSTTGASIVQATPLAGGTSSVVTRLELSDGTRAVLRHVDDTAWLAREPDLLVREAAALGLVRASDVRTPEPIALDAGRGLLLMTWLPGRMVVDETGLTERVARIGRVAADIAAVEVPADHGLPRWTSWVAADPAPPAWGDRALWARAVEHHQQGPAPSYGAPVLLHRDLHPLNLLWHAGDVGVVDWLNACVGPRDAELGHLRWNLAVLAGLDTAEAVTRAYLDAAGAADHDRWWDVTTVLSLLPGPVGRAGWDAAGRRLSADHVVRATERFLAAALRDQ